MQHDQARRPRPDGRTWSSSTQADTQGYDPRHAIPRPSRSNPARHRPASSTRSIATADPRPAATRRPSLAPLPAVPDPPRTHTHTLDRDRHPQSYDLSTKASDSLYPRFRGTWRLCGRAWGRPAAAWWVCVGGWLDGRVAAPRGVGGNRPGVGCGGVRLFPLRHLYSMFIFGRRRW